MENLNECIHVLDELYDSELAMKARAELATLRADNERLREESRNLRRSLFDDIECAVSSRLYETPLKDLHDAFNFLHNLLGTTRAAKEALK